MNVLTSNTATNAHEAKIIVDSFLNALTNEQCFKLASASMAFDSIHKMPLTISMAIGSSCYYYDCDRRIFCSDHIALTILNRGFKYIKETA